MPLPLVTGRRPEQVEADYQMTISVQKIKPALHGSLRHEQVRLAEKTNPTSNKVSVKLRRRNKIIPMPHSVVLKLQHSTSIDHI